MDTSDAVRTVEDTRQAHVAAEESFAKLLTEELSLKAFDLSPTAMTIRQGPPGEERLIRANQAYFDLTGYSADEVIGRLPGEVKLWADHESLVEKFGRMKSLVGDRALGQALRNVRDGHGLGAAGEQLRRARLAAGRRLPPAVRPAFSARIASLAAAHERSTLCGRQRRRAAVCAL